MFDEIMGIPAHPLLVHTAVVFIPLQVLAALVYALVPSVRRYVGWATLGLAVLGPIAAFVAKESGEALEDRLVAGGMTNLTAVHEHADFAAMTLWFTLGLGVLTLVLMAVTRRGPGTGKPTATDADTDGPPVAARSGSKVLALLLTVGIVATGVAAGYYLYKTGDTGARMVWGGM